MDIFLIYKEDYPWDVRVEKIAKTLKQRGHSICIICRNLDQKPVLDEVDGIEIQRLPISSYLPRFVQTLINFPAWFNPVWLFVIYRRLKRSPHSLTIVRDLPLLKSAILLKRFTGTKVILDMAEVYPEMYQSLADHCDRNFTPILKHPSLARLYERRTLPFVDHTFVMIEESRDRLINMGIPAPKVTIVSNTPDTEKFSGSTIQHKGDTLNIVYVGFLTKIRGLDLLIKGIAEALKRGLPRHSINLDIVGKGSEKELLIELVKELQLQDCIKIHGWLDHIAVDNLLSKANVGALTYRVCGHWNHTIPNKLFDYMLAGLPVIATEVIPIERIITEAKCGVICKDQNICDIAEKLAFLRDDSVRNHLGLNGVNWVHQKYNWQRDQENLISVIDSLKADSIS